MQQIFTREEFQDFTQQFRKEWLDDIPSLFKTLQGRFSSDDEISLYSEFKDNIRSAQQFYADESLEDALSELYAQLDAHVSALENEKPAPTWQSSMPTEMDVSPSRTPPHSSTIFDDVDD